MLKIKSHMSREEMVVGGVDHTREKFGHELRRNRRTACWGSRGGFIAAETLDRVISRGEGDHGKGEHKEPEGGSVTEGRSPPGVEKE